MSQTYTCENLPPEWKDLHDALNPFCGKREIEAKSGRLVAAGTISNRESQKRGIPGKKRAGKRVVYPRLEAVKWLMAFVDETASKGGDVC